MEFDIDLIGEIMIPLQNVENSGTNKSSKRFSTVSNFSIVGSHLGKILDQNFKEFRSILFQGELLRLVVVVKLPEKNEKLSKNLLRDTYIKFDFDSSCDQNEIELKNSLEAKNILNTQNNLNTLLTNSQNENDSSQMMTDVDKLNISDLFSLQRNSLFNSSDKYKSYENSSSDLISRRACIDDQILIFEVIRHIIVPNKFLNRTLVLKLNLMKKNYIEYVDTYTLQEILENKVHEDFREFTVIKTLFKEVKIIRPIHVSKTKQIDILPDTSLIQIKLENITSSINFIDKNLKLSKFLKNEKIEDMAVINYGMSLNLKEIQILKEETVVDKKTTINVKILEQYIKSDLNGLFPMSNMEFSILNKDFPIEIKPGEELVIVIKIHKSSFLYEKLEENQDPCNENSSNNITGNTNTGSITAVSSIRKNSTDLSSLNAVGNSRNLNNIQVTKSSNLVTQHNQILMNTNSSNLNTNINYLPNLQTSNTCNIPNNNRRLSPNKHLINDNQENDEIIKVVLSTPLLLNITSYKFYDSLFMSVPLKWQNEITRFLKIEIDIDENITLHEYFRVNLTAKNISNSTMDLLLEISDSTDDFLQDEESVDFKKKK
jgi:hypothetical protein